MSKGFLFALTIITATILAAGCASKRYVRERVEPVNSHVGELDKRSAENASAIQALEDKTQRDTSRVSEKVATADAKAAEAARAAGQANAQATQAGERAEAARTLAENGMAKTDKLEKAIDNLDNYRVSTNLNVYFGFNKSDLGAEAKKDLDALAQSVADQRRFVIEIQGFTDSTGSTDYNYALSERRADTVARYLTTQHKIPVYRIHTLGLGKDVPAEGANQRETRKLSRRVEVKLYTPAP